MRGKRPIGLAAGTPVLSIAVVSKPENNNLTRKKDQILVQKKLGEEEAFFFC